MSAYPAPSVGTTPGVATQAPDAPVVIEILGATGGPGAGPWIMATIILVVGVCIIVAARRRRST